MSWFLAFAIYEWMPLGTNRFGSRPSWAPGSRMVGRPATARPRAAGRSGRRGIRVAGRSPDERSGRQSDEIATTNGGGEVRGLTKSYGSVHAVRGIDATVTSGETV